MAFKDSIEVVLFFEGGYVSNPRDPGGETNWGISKRQYPNLDIRNLTRDQAIGIYENDYWNRCVLGHVVDQVVATKVLDMVVNMGPGFGIMSLQKAVNKLFGFNKLVIDGLMGTNTLSAVNSVPPLYTSIFVDLLKAEARKRHTDIGFADPELREFMAGWLRRDYWPYRDDGREWPYLPKPGEGWPKTQGGDTNVN